MQKLEGTIGIAKPERFFAPWEFVRSLLSAHKKYGLITSSGALIEENRNQLVQKAKHLDWLLMVDTDIVFKKSDVDGMVKHIEDGKDVVFGLSKKSCSPYDWNYQTLDNDVPVHTKGIFEIKACAMQFTIISKRAMNIVDTRPFDRINNKGILLGEDYSFCFRARHSGLKIWCDPNIKPQHIVSMYV